jgi:hypothetical protein
MPVILRLVWFGIIIEIVPRDNHLRRRCAPRGSSAVQTLSHHLEHDLDAAVQRQQVRLQQDRRHGVAAQRAAHSARQADRPGVVGEQGGERVQAQHAALVQRRQDGHLVVAGASEAAAVVQVDGEAVVAEELECLVVVAVHVAHQEVVHGQVDQVQQSAAEKRLEKIRFQVFAQTNMLLSIAKKEGLNKKRPTLLLLLWQRPILL